ncbi:acyl-[acyl-carrier-protein]--UDP-N-acetylglucosamine O-acyltransferase [Kangiella profundi]|uniref:Acyl-[acyl-carrier-protein]--UDP-N-acetylglucosamine O-acyltransferase n=1 Tax=Kangiella profundi TaxID=1561924 RepID=A0A2K9A9E7_9GAMM|nr:acyl-ACP--UDP-N-acetylglucosamine O-acyltransferase [Kangiella profundi]AUD79350.1 acyl-[acyl-carrier-protein]--UDP-N-acetylglucosamine O-acyltransferase [Kangiella profundi]GGE99342.1 acyl-[acyl-carrier-protein]--UDP-N-acetylglucosamine O-acyltransferase [Kangiella profundi]
MIHPTAIIDPSANIAEDVEIGPYSIIGKEVSIDSGTVVGPHVVIGSYTTIGKNNRFFQFSSIGEENQDKKYAGEPTRTIIGDGNVFRECCTVHRGTVQDNSETRIGNNGWFMAYTHIAHDCVLGDNIIMSNNATLAGHVHVGDHVILSGFAKIHQFCKIGAHAFIGMDCAISKDIPPFVLVAENAPYGLNSEGLKRRGFSADSISELKRAYRTIYRKSLKTEEAIAEMSESSDPHVQQMIEFLQNANRGILR